MMKKTLYVLMMTALLAACDKAEDKAPADEPAAEKPAEEAEKPAEESEEAEPTETAESQKAAPEFPDDLNPGEQGFYGAEFTVIEPPITLAKAIEQADEHDGSVKIEATVQAVCKKKGCWFTMSDDSTDEVVRVKMKDYGFFVPKNTAGARVVAEGLLTSKEISQEEAQHYADDAAEEGEEPEKVEGPQKVWQFTATAVEMKQNES